MYARLHRPSELDPWELKIHPFGDGRPARRLASWNRDTVLDEARGLVRAAIVDILAAVREAERILR